ncbi:MAG: PrgI family protein [Actinobacteria bacterium]|nr:PrgI family protein [Actinomycetota bacterium]
MTMVYSDYSKDRIGWFFGLSAWKLAVLVAAGAPMVVALRDQRWVLLLGWAAGWALLLFLVAVPIAGRSSTSWLAAVVRFGLGRAFGWTSWRSRAATGVRVESADLPGVLAGIEVHDGPPTGPSNTRVAIIQDHAAGTWAATAAIVHPGLALADPAERARHGAGLTALLNACARTEKISEVLFVIRSAPEDGAEREQWLHAHTRATAPPLARTINEQLAQTLSRAGLATELYMTIVATEARLARDAREFGSGIDGRARALGILMAEVETQLRDGLQMTEVTWLTSPQLATAVRTGFAPGDRPGIIAALAEHLASESVNADVPWALAGPSGAQPQIRSYRHDAWASVSSTVRLPARGAVIGALMPVITPTEPGERRSLLIAYPIVSRSAAEHQTQTGEFSADMAESLKARMGMKTRAKERQNAATTRRLDAKLASGDALIRPYAVATVTVPETSNAAEFGRRLDASIRRAGFVPQRLDIAHDAGFAASSIPLGISLARTGNRR